MLGKVNTAVSRRESSIEFLRLLLMFLIVVHHAIVHGLGLSGFSSTIDTEVVMNEMEYPLFISVNCLCICAVNCFILISGFFGIRPTARKFGKLLFAVAFYTLLFYTLWTVINRGGVVNALCSMLLLSHSPYWFIVDYLLLMAFAPMLNVMFQSMSKRNVTMIVVAMIFVSCYLGFVWHYKSNPMGYNLFQFVTMYCVGRYLAIYAFDKIRWTKTGWTGIYILAALANAGIVYILAVNGKLNLSWRMTYYNNPLVILSAISLFMVFKQMSFHSGLINRVSASALAVYLFQSSPAVSEVFYRIVKDVAFSCRLDQYGWTLLGIIIVMSFVIVALSLLFDRIRLYIWGYVSRWSDKNIVNKTC